MTKSTTLVTFLLDRSGSMSGCKPATIEAFNAYLATLQAEGTDDFNCEFTFLQFDTQSLDKVYLCEPVKNVAKLTDASYQPRGGTPLIDSCMKTILALESSLAKRDDKPKVIVCFQTDGEENASRDHTTADLKAKIEECQAKGWQFNFMGAGLDVYSMATKMGINASSTMAYNHNNLGATKSAFAATASNSRLFGSGMRANTSYTGAQRMASQDAFADADLMKAPDVAATPAVDLTPKADKANVQKVDLTNLAGTGRLDLATGHKADTCNNLDLSRQ